MIIEFGIERVGNISDIWNLKWKEVELKIYINRIVGDSGVRFENWDFVFLRMDINLGNFNKVWEIFLIIKGIFVGVVVFYW